VLVQEPTGFRGEGSARQRTGAWWPRKTTATAPDAESEDDAAQVFEWPANGTGLLRLRLEAVAVAVAAAVAVLTLRSRRQAVRSLDAVHTSCHGIHEEDDGDPVGAEGWERKRTQFTARE